MATFLARPWALGLLVFVLALAPRLWGFDWQLPYALYNDELKYYTWASAAAADDRLPSTDFRNPSLFRHLMTLEYRLLRPVTGPTPPGTDDDRANAVIRLAAERLTVAVMGAGSVSLTALTAATLFGPITGLIAGVLLGTNYLHAHLSHIGVNDVPATLFGALALLFGARGLRSPARREFFLAGLSAGLAGVTKYSFGAYVLVPTGVALALLLEGRLSRREAILRLLLVGEGAILGMALGMPEVMSAPRQVVDGIGRQMELGMRGWRGQSQAIPLEFYANALLRSAGPPAVVLALVGVGRLLLGAPLRAAALLACPAVLLLVLSGQRMQFVRFALPLMPFVALFAAAGLTWIVRRLNPRWRGPALAALLLAAGLLPTADVVRMDLLIARPDTRALAADWVREHLPPGSRIVAQSTALPIDRSGGGDDLDAYEVQRVYSLVEQNDVRQLRCDGFEYLVLSSHDYDLHRTRSAPGRTRTGYELMEQEGELLALLSPRDDGQPSPYNVDDNAIPFWELWQYDRPGPTVKIYRLPEPSAVCRA